MVDKRTIHKLSDSMHGYDCPLCTLLESMNNDHIRILLYESVNDRTLRKRFLQDEGFCAFHAKKVLNEGAPLNHAILYDALLEEKLKSYQKDKPLIKKTDCLFCEKERDNEAYLIKAFIDGMNEEDFVARYKEEGLLCFAHLDPINAQLKRDKHKRNLIKTITLEKYNALSTIFKSIKMKHDYRYSGTSWTEEERKLWQEAVKLLIQNNDHRE